MGMNQVEIKWNGLRFGQNESYGCQKAFGMPPEAQYTNKKIKKYREIPKIYKILKNVEKPIFPGPGPTVGVLVKWGGRHGPNS